MPSWDYRQAGLYDNFGLENDYTLVEGVFALPVAEETPTDPTALAAWSPVHTVRAHAPYRIRTVDFTVRKTGNPPVVPSPGSAGKHTFLGGVLAFAHPSFNLTLGRYDWTVGGSYSFVETCRSNVEDGFVLGGGSFGLESQVYNASQLQPSTPAYGAISAAGTDARRGYSQASQISMDNPGWIYDTVTYFPATFFNDEQLKGETYFPGLA
jgi:hypothetical protein